VTRCECPPPPTVCTWYLPCCTLVESTLADGLEVTVRGGLAVADLTVNALYTMMEQQAVAAMTQRPRTTATMVMELVVMRVGD